MRPTAKSALRLLAVTLAVAGSIWMSVVATGIVETRQTNAVQSALGDAGYGWASVEVDGLIATLSGAAPDEATRFRALATAGQVLNPTHLRDNMAVAAAGAHPPPEFQVEILRNGSFLTVHGLLPGGPEASTALADALATVTPEPLDTALLTASPEDAPEGWDTALSRALPVLRALDTVRVTVRPGRLEIDGIAPTREVRDTVTQAARQGLPDLLAVDVALRLPRPVVTPFVTRMRADAGAARLEACSVSTEAGAAQVMTAAEQAGVTEDHACRVALGAPDAYYDQVVVLAIRALDAIAAGTVTVSDLTVTLVPDVVTDPEALAAAVTALEDELPPLYRLSVLTPQGTANTDLSDRRVAFGGTRSPEGLVNLRGPLPDRQTRSMVESFAKAQFGTPDLHLALRQQPGLPAGWGVRVMAGLEALGMLDTGSVSVQPAMLKLSGTTGDPDLRAQLAAMLETALGRGAPYAVDVTYVAPPPLPDPAEAPRDCIAEIDEVQNARKIVFGPGETALDADALDIVRDIAKILRGCPDAEFEIGGHTDAQGRAEMNLALSQARADSVFNALLAEDVLVGRLTSVGYGEEKPVADNDTAEGRERNRRIEFRLLGQPGTETVSTSGNPELTDMPEDSDGSQ